MAAPAQPSVIEYLASCRGAAQVHQATARVDANAVDITTTAAKQMNNSILEYNDRVRNAAWRIQRRTQTVLVALCEATPTTISLLEDHYSTIRHTDGALTLEQLGFCDLTAGISRIPNGMLDVPPIWKMIMHVSPNAIEEFVRNLACWLALGSTPVFYLVGHHASVSSGIVRFTCNLTTRCVEPFWTSTAR